MFRIRSFGLTDVGRKRSRNEDCMLLNPNLGLFVVADGMGGHSGGEFASKLAVATIDEVIQSLSMDPEATVISGVNSEEAGHGERLRYAIEVASQKIYDQALYDQQLRGMGTTTAAVIIREDMANVANVGDSRVYLFRDGTLKQITRDHSLVSEQMRAGILSEVDARRHKFKNIITRSVGYQEEVEADLFNVQLKPHDKLLICSDGLTNLVDDHSLKEVLAAGDAPENVCRKLVKMANDNGGDDNITVIVCDVSEKDA